MERLRHDLDTVVSRFARKYVGLAAVTVRDGKTAMTGRGRVNGSDIPPTIGTLFRVCTAVDLCNGLLLADLVRRGQTTFDTAVAELFPDVQVPVHGRRMTLGDLATHTSGLPRTPRERLPPSARRGLVVSPRVDPDDLDRLLAGARLRRAPGERAGFSRLGVALLAEALSRLAGTSYEQLVLERICEPLGMTDTGAHLTDEQHRRLARCHTRTGKALMDEAMPDVTGQGALFSTAADMGALLRVQLEPPENGLGEAIRMTHEPRTREDGGIAMCLGWSQSRLKASGERVLWHNGGGGGAASFIGFVPRWGDGVVVLTNCARSVDRLGWDLLRAIGPASTAA